MTSRDTLRSAVEAAFRPKIEAEIARLLTQANDVVGWDAVLATATETLRAALEAAPDADAACEAVRPVLGDLLRARQAHVESTALCLLNGTVTAPRKPAPEKKAANPSQVMTPERWVARKKNAHGRRVVDLFAGAGGLSLGFAQAGYKVVGAFETWTAARETYAANFDHPVHDVDLADVDKSVRAIKKLKPNVIVGGPPCTDYSSAGRREEGEKAGLTVAFARIVAAVQPESFVMENVERALTSRAYREAKRILEAGGYGLTETVIDAAKVGAPQHRTRLIVAGRLGAERGWLNLAKGLREHPMTLAEAFGEAFPATFYAHPRAANRRAIYSRDEPAPTVRGTNRPRPATYAGHEGDAGQDGERLSHEWRALIQTFPPDFVWRGPQTAIDQMVGNAVPPVLARHVAAALMAQDAGRKRRKHKYPHDSRKKAATDRSETACGQPWEEAA